jgi:hypothetical protein
MTHDEGTDEVRDPADTTDDTDDTEGHSIAALLAMRELGKAGARPRDPKAGRDDELPPLTKKFPSLRTDSRSR